jgi:sirohydrochlorin ferrochelatase
VTVAHGTSVSRGNLVAAAITARAARRMGRLRSQTAYVELCQPSFREVMRDNRAPSVVVPLLLSTGFHVKQDIPGAVGMSPTTALLARPLGPHPLLAEVMCLRLRGAGAHPRDPVVLVAAGSNDPDTAYDLAAAGRMLQARWGSPVRVATISGSGRSVNEVVDEARADGRVAVVPYLLASGFFSRQARALAELAGAATIADVIGAHPLVAELVVRRYRAVLAASRAAA